MRKTSSVSVKKTRSVWALLLFVSICLILFASAKKHNSSFLYGKSFEKSLAYIPSGTLEQVECTKDSCIKWKLSFQSFYMWPTEVSNHMYLEYTEDLHKTDSLKWIKSLPDTNVWLQKTAYCEPYRDYYFRHPAYAEFPVVGISHTQALEFCEWLSSKLKATGHPKFKNCSVDLPLEKEWMYAASALKNNTPFSWAQPFLHNKNGDVMANFVRIPQWFIVRNDSTGKFEIRTGGYNYFSSLEFGMDIFAPVKSYWPNEFGLYNMCGNVEEFVKEVGISKGGSWRDPGSALLLSEKEIYSPNTSASAERGFRFVIRNVE